MSGYKPRVISLTKRPGHTFGFYLRVEHGEDGHLIRCLEMGGPAELAGMKDGDRVLRVDGKYVDGTSHSEVVEMVRNSGNSVTFHVLDEASYKKAKAKGVNLSGSQGTATATANGVAKHPPKAKLCYLMKSSSGFGFSLLSSAGNKDLFMTEVIPDSSADRAGVRVNDRLVEVNGENVEDFTHDQAVDMLKRAGSKSIMLLLVDQEADRYYKQKQTKVTSWLATTKYLPSTPRILNITKGHDGYGFLLKEEDKQTGHFIRDIDRGSPAERAGMKDMDRLVAVDGMEVEDLRHDQVVDRVRQSGNTCCFLVMDKEVEQMYKLGKVSPMLFWDEMKHTNSPPSYTEAISSPTPVQTSTSAQDRTQDLKPKLCKMQKTSAGYGFHLNSIQGVFGQYITDVVKGGAADRAGLDDNDIVVEVNGENVEKSTHGEVVSIIQRSDSHLEMLVAKKSVYDKLKAEGVVITRLLLGETSYAQVHTAESPKTRREEKEEEKDRPDTPTQPARDRSASASSSSSQESFDERM